MVRRVALALVLALACPSGAAPAPAPPAQGHDAAPAPEAFALFDHLAIVAVTRPSHPPAIPTMPSLVPPITLSLDGERGFTAVPRAPSPSIEVPPWMQTHLGDVDIDHYAAQADGSWIAWANHVVILIDRAHHPEVGLDFTAQPAVNGTAWRVGDVVIVEEHRDQSTRLLGVLASTGEIAWASATDLADLGPGGVVFAGHLVTCARVRGSWELVAIAFDTGATDARVPLSRGPYALDEIAPGVIQGLHGTPPSVLRATIAVR